MTEWLDSFMVRALIAGISVALLTGPLGCHVLWRRMAYYGETISHAAILGVAIALLVQIDQTLGVFLIAAAVSIAMMVLQRGRDLSADALLGILAHGSLALGLVLVSLLPGVRVDLMGLLFGDILSVSTRDLLTVVVVVIVALAVLWWIWRPLVAASTHPELAQAEGKSPERYRLILMLLMAVTVSVGMKIVGVLLMTALLIIPAAAARRLSASPEAMALVAALVGVIAVIGGLFGSLQFDTPSGPSIVVVAMLLFLLARLLPARASHDNPDPRE